MRQVLVPASIAPAVPPAASCVQRTGGTSMGTSWSVKAAMDNGALAPLTPALQATLDTVVEQMSHWLIDSNLGRFNRAPAGSWHTLPEPFFSVLEYALAVSEDSGGAYNPCAGSLVNLWGFGPGLDAVPRFDQQHFQAPAAPAVAAHLRKGSEIILDRAGKRAFQPGGVQLDLSSVAKGFAVDQLARCLDSHGVHHYLAEIGGELRGAGMRPDRSPWWVELEGVPDEPAPADSGAATAPTIVALHGMAVATSGDYRRQFSYAGGRASHTLDPRTGYPIANRVASVTVLHRHCMAADALSTALSVLGLADGLRFANQRELAARFLLRGERGLEEHQSDAWRGLLQ